MSKIKGSQIRDESLTSDDVKDDSLTVDDLNTTTVGKSVITRIFAAFGIQINSSTGADSGTGGVTLALGPHSHTHIKQLSGRFEIDTDDDWASWSDPNFGPSLHDWDFDLGNGAVPNVDWDGIGLAFPKGAILKRMFVKMRGNNTDIDDIQVHARMHDVDLLTSPNAIDSNAEVGAVELGTETFSTNLGAANGNDLIGFEMSLADYQVLNDGADLHVSMRSAPGSTTANRNVRCTIFIEFTLPNNLEDNS